MTIQIIWPGVSHELALIAHQECWQSCDRRSAQRIAVQPIQDCFMPPSVSDLDAQRRALLERLFAAFNHHDGAGVMACMTDDVVFETAAGPEMCGRRVVGAVNVKAAFEQVWTAMPDVSWTCTRHSVFQDRALSEWIFRATTADRSRIEVEGCDLFMFAGDRIAHKRAFRKDRPLQPALSASEKVAS